MIARPGRFALLLCVLVAGCQAQGADAPRPGAPPTAERFGFDHSIYDEIMREHVSADGLLDYRALQSKHAGALNRYVESLGAADPEGFADRDDELAFWLNAYNAFVITGVLDRYPGVRSVMDAPDFFKVKRWKAARTLRSLDEIENQIIRPRFKDPRVHFVLVCAAVSCPPLPRHAMAPATVQTDLDRYTRRAVNSTKYVEVDPVEKKLRLTKIMRWYSSDFIEGDGSLEAFLLRYLDDPVHSQLEAGGYTIEFKDYDWALNDVPR
jgi:hypothetical protein